MASITGMQKELVRRLKDNSFQRDILTTRGQLDTYQAGFYKTTKRLYRQKQENTGKKLVLHLIIDASGSMGMGNDRDLPAFLSAKTMRDTFKEVADVHIYYYANIVQHTSDELIDQIEKSGWTKDCTVFEKNFIANYIRRHIPIMNIVYRQYGMQYRYARIENTPWHEAEETFRAQYEQTREDIEKAGATLVDADMDDMCNVENDELFALDQVFGKCEQDPGNRHVVFLMTDGGCMCGANLYAQKLYHPTLPSGVYVGNMRKPNSKESLDKFVRRRTKGRDITFIPVGIGNQATKEVKDIFGYGVGYDIHLPTQKQVQQFLSNTLRYCKKLPIFR